MRCDECGVDLPSAETCLDRFHTLLAAEVENDELRHMHGLTVLTYHLQHPSLTKPWYQDFGARVLRRVFEQGEDWGAGEMTIATIDPNASPGLAEQILTWARSVAECRFLRTGEQH